MGDGRFQKGQPAWNRKEHLEKTCPKCGKIFYVKQSLARIVCCSASCATRGRPSGYKGRKSSLELRARLRASHLALGNRKPDDPNWSDAEQRHREQGRDRYKQWRRTVLERDNHTCVLCGAHGVKINADHIKPWAIFPERRYDVSNGRTLCVPCHEATPAHGRSKARMLELREIWQ